MKKFYLFLTGLLFASVQMAAQNYTDGVFVLNEDWYGHNNSSMNFWNCDGDFVDYYIVQIANNYEFSLGCTSQYGQLYGDYIVITSKQDKDPGDGSDMKSGRLTILNKNTLKVVGDEVHPLISVNVNGKSDADGRGVCFVDNEKFYVGTSNGIYVVKLTNGNWLWDSEKIIAGTGNELITGQEVSNADGIGPLYNNQIGMMLRTQDYVWAIKQDLGIMIIDPATDEIIDIIEGCYSTMSQSMDGNVWVGMNVSDKQKYPYGNSGDAWIGSELLCIDQYTLETKTIELTLGGVPQSWYAWTAGSLTASNTENVLYFVYTDPSAGQINWFRNCNLYRYDIDNDQCEEIYNSENDGLYFYGGALQCNPKDGNIYAALYVGENIATQDWVYATISGEGEMLQYKQPIQNYWYPAMYLFPDNEAPIVEKIDDVVLKDESVTISLCDKVSDSDSNNAAIVKSIKSIGDNSVINAEIVAGELILTPLSNGKTIVELAFNSNGKIVTTDISVSVENEVDSINNVEYESAHINVFTVSGNIMITGLNEPQQVEVYNAQGQLMRSVVVENADCIEGLTPSNLYILKISNQSFKIIL